MAASACDSFYEVTVSYDPRGIFSNVTEEPPILQFPEMVKELWFAIQLWVILTSQSSCRVLARLDNI